MVNFLFDYSLKESTSTEVEFKKADWISQYTLCRETDQFDAHRTLRVALLIANTIASRARQSTEKYVEYKAAQVPTLSTQQVLFPNTFRNWSVQAVPHLSAVKSKYLTL